MDTRYVTEEHARILGRNAVLDVGPSQQGHTEGTIRTQWQELFAAQDRQ